MREDFMAVISESALSRPKVMSEATRSDMGMVMTRKPGMTKTSTLTVDRTVAPFETTRSASRNSFWRKSTSVSTAMVRKNHGTISRKIYRSIILTVIGSFPDLFDDVHVDLVHVEI